MKESQHLQDTKDRQLQELKQMVEETNTTKKHEFEKKVKLGALSNANKSASQTVDTICTNL